MRLKGEDSRMPTAGEEGGGSGGNHFEEQLKERWAKRFRGRRNMRGSQNAVDATVFGWGGGGGSLEMSVSYRFLRLRK